MEQAKDATTNQLWQRQAAADNGVRGQWLMMGRKIGMRPLTIELMIAPRRLAPTRTDGSNRASKGRRTTQQLNIV
jgi:hypothetical protein